MKITRKHLYKKGEIVKFNYKLVKLARDLVKLVIESPVMPDDYRGVALIHYYASGILSPTALASHHQNLLARFEDLAENDKQEEMLRLQKIQTISSTIINQYGINLPLLYLVADPYLEVRVVKRGSASAYAISIDSTLNSKEAYNTHIEALGLDDGTKSICNSVLQYTLASTIGNIPRAKMVVTQTLLVPKDFVPPTESLKLVLDF